MAKSNLNTQAKRKRELAKKDKRANKDEKRAVKKDEARVARGEPPTPAPSKAAPGQWKPQSAAAAAFVRAMNIRRPGTK